MNGYLIIAFFLNFGFISSFEADEEFAPIINLRHGKVRGLIRTIGEGDQKRKIHFYQGFRFGMINSCWISFNFNINFFKIIIIPKDMIIVLKSL